MQRERSTFNSFPEPIDLNQGSLSNSSLDHSSLDHSATWDNMLNPVENRLSNYMLSSADGNANCVAANDITRSFSGWDRGESSSSANNLRDGAFGDNSKVSLGWSASFNAYSGSDVRSENGPFGPSSISPTSYVGNQLTSNRPLGMHNYSSNHAFVNANSNGLMREYDLPSGVGAGLPHSVHKPGHSEMEQISTLNASSSNAGTSLGSFFQETNDASGPSFGTYSSSCKRKALEGTSRLFGPGGSSSSSQLLGRNTMQQLVPDCYAGPGSLSISSGTLSLSPINHSELLNPSSGIGVSRVSPGLFPSSGVSGTTESSARNFTINSNDRWHESVPFDTLRGTSTRNFGVYAGQMPRPSSNMDSSELRPPVNQNSDCQPYLMHVNDPRGMHSYPWNGCFSARGGSSLSASMISGERGSVAREEVNARSSRRNSLEHLMAVSVPETGNILQDQIDWSFAPGTLASSRNHSSGSRVGHSSTGWTSSSWLPYQTQSSQNHQRESESAPWFPYPYVESEPGTQRSQFAHFPPSSSSDGAASTSHGSQHQLHQNTAAFLMSMPSDDINSWHAMTAVDGRQRLIHQVLTAMRRGSRVQAEDYIIDPFINGYAEIHDRHRDMRLDVDNMSYEELLALEERIGNVSTGLNEEKINSYMKQRIYKAMGVSQKLEPCCICQEEYIARDNLGILDCGHEFHTRCIKQWLMLKNLCPICKTTALET